MIEEFVSLAFRNIKHRKKRTALTIIGVFIGIMAVVSLVSLGQGLQDSIQQQFEEIGSDKLFINPGGSPQQASAEIEMGEDDLQAVKNTRGVDDAAAIIFTTTAATHQGDQAFVSLLGAPTDSSYSIVKTSWAIQLADGRDLRPTDTSNVVIGSQLADSAFGEELGVRSRIEMDGERFQVVGVMKPTGDPAIDRSVIMTRERARDVTGREEGYDWIFARTQQGFTPSEVETDVEENLRDARNVEEGEEDFSVSTQEELLESFNNILDVVRGVVIGIASISLVVGAVNITNTMYTSVTERTREIGVMKAIGASRRQILFLFLIESALIGFVGGLTGVVTGLGISILASHFATQATGIAINAYISPLLIAGAIAFSTLLGVIAGVHPAKQAEELPPAEALRYE